MPLIYGNVPRNLKGSYNYAQSAMVNEDVTAGNATSSSYFEAAKHIEDTTHVAIALVAPAASNYSVNVEVSHDDGVNWRVLRNVTQTDAPSFRVAYESADMKLRLNVISATGPVRCIMQQA